MDIRYKTLLLAALVAFFTQCDNDGETWATIGVNSKKGMLLYNGIPITLVAVAYKGEVPHIGVLETTSEGDANCNQSLKMSVEATTLEKFDETLAKYDTYSAENKIAEDLEYQASFAILKKKQEKLKDERDFMYRLWWIAYPCCYSEG